jgi:hypothetical protein
MRPDDDLPQWLADRESDKPKPEHTPGEELAVNIITGVVFIGGALLVYYLVYKIIEAVFS